MRKGKHRRSPPWPLTHSFAQLRSDITDPRVPPAMRPVPALSSALPAGGGFFLPSFEAASAAASSSAATGAGTSLAPLPTDPQDALRLSPVQLTRLRSHLDSRILSIQRRWAKRFHHRNINEGVSGAAPTTEGAGGSGSGSSPSDPLTSGGAALDSVGKYVTAWTDEVLPLLVRVDPVGASQSTTAVAYAMRMTELLLMGVVGYETLEERGAAQQSDGARHSERSGEQQQKQEPQQQHFPTSGLTRVLQALHLVDALWASLLTGRRLSLPHALARSSASLSIASSSTSSSSTAHQSSASSTFSAPTRDSAPLSGSMGIKTLSGTDRVRLRNLLVDRRSEVRRWVAGVLGVVLAGPAPGEEEEQVLPGGGGGPSRLNGVSRGSMPPMQGRRKRGRAALVEPLMSAEEASQKDGIAEVEEEESDGENGGLVPATVGAAVAQAPAAKRRKRTRGDTKRAAQVKAQSDEDEEEEEEMEEVAVPVHVPVANGPSGGIGRGEQRVKVEEGEEGPEEAETEEHRHYQALFDRKIDLDDDNDDDDDDDDEENDGDGIEGDALPRDEDDDLKPAMQAAAEEASPHLMHDSLVQVNGTGNGTDAGVSADAGRLGSFELDVLLARLFSRSLALLERLE